MAWAYVIVAGLLESIWEFAIKAGGLRTPVTGAVMLCAMAASFTFLSTAMRSLSLSAAYVAWTGIGAVGSFVLGVMAFGEPLTTTGVLGALLILAGMFLRRHGADGVLLCLSHW